MQKNTKIILSVVLILVVVGVIWYQRTGGNVTYAGFTKLIANGNRIVDEHGQLVHLVGVLGILKCFSYNDLLFQNNGYYLDQAKSLGMQILRIGIDMGSYVTAPYTYNDAFFSQAGGLDWVLDWCDANGIKVILNANFEIEFGNYFSYAAGHGFPAYMTPASDYTNDLNGRHKAWSDFWYARAPQQDSKAQLIDAWKHVVARYNNRQCIVAWDTPVNEPTSGWPNTGYDPATLKPVYYAYCQAVIDAIRSIDVSQRLCIVETLDTCGWNLPQYAGDVGRPNIAYDVHPYAAGGLGIKYDPTLPGLAESSAGWNKAGIMDWMQVNVVQPFMTQLNRPVIILEIDHLIGSSAYGDWHQYYWDVYDIYRTLNIWVSAGYRGGGGTTYAMWYPDGTIKPYLDVLTAYSTNFFSAGK